MTLVLALGIGVLFGAGSYLLLQRDLLRAVIGVLLISNAANLALMSAGRERGDAPIAPFTDTTSDPLVQAMTVTALVIAFAVATLLFSIVYRVYRSEGSVDVDELSQMDVEHEEAVERERGAGEGDVDNGEAAGDGRSER